MENNQKLSIVEKLSYGVGDLACNLFWGLICVATVFYTDYFGIDAKVAGTMILIISCIDIAFDVVIGAIADRKNSRWGRFRPWILFGLIPFCVIGYMTFRTPAFSDSGKIIYAYLTFLAFRLMYSVVNVPYGALMGVISAEPKERDVVSSYRNVLAQVGCLLSYGFVFTIVRTISQKYQQSGQEAFATTALIYAVAAAILLFCTFFFTRERVEPVKKETSNLSEDMKDLGHNVPWISLTVAGIAFLFFVFVHNGLVPYYAKYYVADTKIHDEQHITQIIEQPNEAGKMVPFAYVLENGVIDTISNGIKFPLMEDGKPVVKDGKAVMFGTERMFQTKNEKGEYASIDVIRGTEDEKATPMVGDRISYFTFEVNGSIFGIKLNWELVSTILLGLGSILTIIGTLLIQIVVRKFGKKPTWIGCFILASVLSLSFMFVPKENVSLILLLNLLFTLSIGPCGYIMWSMYADVADNAEVETGRRATGLIYSSATMAQKLGTALANAIPAFALATIGFVANTQLAADIISSIKNIYSLLPLVGSIIAIIALFFYKIDEDMIKRNSEILEKQRAAAPEKEE
jgi:GPH family glycoside/pentoside/hexuronide:cation symporter